MVCQQTNKANRKMPPRRTRLKIPGMCAEDPPSYSELETNDRDRLRREAALAQVSQDATFYTLRFGWIFLKRWDLAEINTCRLRL